MAKDDGGKSGEGGLDLSDLPFGTLNFLRDDSINDSGDRRRGNPLSFLAQTMAKAFGIDTLKDVTDFRGIVLDSRKVEGIVPISRSQILNAYLNISLGGKILKALTGDKTVYAYKVFIPELEMRPPPTGKEDPVIDTYADVYDGRLDEDSPIPLGTVVTVVFEDFKNLLNPRITAAEEKPLIIKGFSEGSVLDNLKNFFSESPKKEKVEDKMVDGNEKNRSPLPRARSKPGASATAVQQKAADDLGLDVKIVQAIEAVESGGKPCAVRFEPHVFHRKAKAAGKANLNSQIPFTRNSSVPFSRVRAETNEAALDHAMTVHPTIALESTSFGLYQVMGSGFPRSSSDPKGELARFRADCSGVSYELLGSWFRKSYNKSALQAAKDRDWRKLASKYNGPANVDKYAPRLESEYNALASVEPADKDKETV
tara:strand:+ start:2099 stop:3376 length:1278 start_codon:yes stop_codon:yes gene_type:complete